MSTRYTNNNSVSVNAFPGQNNFANIIINAFDLSVDTIIDIPYMGIGSPDLSTFTATITSGSGKLLSSTEVSVSNANSIITVTITGGTITLDLQNTNGSIDLDIFFNVYIDV